MRNERKAMRRSDYKITRRPATETLRFTFTANETTIMRLALPERYPKSFRDSAYAEAITFESKFYSVFSGNIFYSILIAQRGRRRSPNNL